METKVKLMIPVLIAVVAAGIIFFVMPKNTNDRAQVVPSTTPSSSAIPQEIASKSLGEEIFEKSQNPMENKIPQTNPFEAKTNPFRDAYINPFAE